MAETKDLNPSEARRRSFWFALLVLVLVTAGVFAGVLGDKFLWYDDDTYVLKNPLIHPLNLETIAKMFVRTYFRSYTPLAHLSHAIDFDIWGANPFGHHLTNYLLHLINAALVFVLAAVSTVCVRNRPAGGRVRPFQYLLEHLTSAVVLGALFASAFFAIHPLRVESVAWVSDRKDLLMTFFSLISFLCYFSYRLGTGAEGINRWYLGSVIAAVCAMLAKTVASVIPIVLLLADFLVFGFPARGKRGWKLLVEKFPFFAGTVLVGIASLFAVSKILPHPRVIERTGLEEALAPFYTWAFYLAKSFLPVGLTPLYAFPGMELLLLGLLVALVVTAFTFILARRRMLIPLFAWGFYTLFLLPTILGRGPAGIQSWADRYSYLPGIAIALLLGGLVVWLWEKLRGMLRISLFGALALGLVLLGVMTVRQIPIWHDTVSLFTYAVEQNPRSIMAHTNLGNALTNAGRPDEAIASLQQALALNDRFSGVYQYLGLAYELKGDHLKAVEFYQRAVALDSNFVEAYSNLGNAYFALGAYDRAIQQYREAIRKDPEFADPYYNLGVVTYTKGDTAAAMAVFRKAAEVNPNSADTYVSMGIIYSGWGMDDSAYVQYERAAQLGHPQARELVKSRRR
jgi:tetratricopeptide (TPR) repeat protein